MRPGNTPVKLSTHRSACVSVVGKFFDTINYDILLDKLSYYDESDTALKLSKKIFVGQKTIHVSCI